MARPRAVAPAMNFGGTGTLMRLTPIQNLMAMGGVRVAIELPAFMEQLGADFLDNPVRIAGAAHWVVNRDPMLAADFIPNVVVQVCAVGYPAETIDAGRLRVKIGTNMRDHKQHIGATALAELTAEGGAAQWLDSVEPLTPAIVTIESLRAVIIAITQDEEAAYQSAVKCFTMSVVTCCKQGNATNSFCQKVINAVREELGVNINFGPHEIRQSWNILKNFFNPAKAAHFFRIWEEGIGNACMRLRLTLQQAGWTSMTNYQNISLAKTRFPNFNWAGLHALCPEDFANYAAAVTAVAGNPYYGYNVDLGPAKSTLYPNLSYAAYNLLREIGGEQSLRDFRGVNTRVPLAAAIDALINTFKAQYTAQAQENAAAPPEASVAAATVFAGLNPLAAP